MGSSNPVFTQQILLSPAGLNKFKRCECGKGTCMEDRLNSDGGRLKRWGVIIWRMHFIHVENSKDKPNKMLQKKN